MMKTNFLLAVILILVLAIAYFKQHPIEKPEIYRPGIRVINLNSNNIAWEK
jgi:hypothetical protein